MAKGKRKRVERGYEVGDEMVEGRVKGRRVTQEGADSLRRRWKRNQELQYDKMKFAKFAKPEPAPRPKSLSRRQRRNARKMKKSRVSDWPTKREMKKKQVEHRSWQDAATELQLVQSAQHPPPLAPIVDERQDLADDSASLSQDEDFSSSGESEMPDIDMNDDEEEASNVDDDQSFSSSEEIANDVRKQQLEECLKEEEISELKERIKKYIPCTILDHGWSLSTNGRSLKLEDPAFKLQGDWTKTQKEIIQVLSSWRDALLITGSPCIPRQSRRIQFLEPILAHVLSETLRSRRAVLKHDAKLRKKDITTALEQPRDQGISRPRVLILSPLRGHALDVISLILKILNARAIIKNRPQVELAFASLEQETNSQKGPRDWEEVFGQGRNIDDDFELGITLTPGLRRSSKNDLDKTSLIGVTLDTPLARSDIIIASAAKLRARLESDGSLDEFSSLEICVLDAADIMLYQNWDFVLAVLNALNRRPRLELPPTLDIRRIRLPELENQAKYCRQTIILSTFADARLRAAIDAPGRDPSARELLLLDKDDPIADTASLFARNRAGAVRFSPLPVSEQDSALTIAMNQIQAKCRFIFTRLSGSTPAAASDAKLNYFKIHLASKLKPRTLIFANTYHDFLACRAALRSAAVDFVSIHEYSRGSEISRARSNFFHGRVSVLLYSGRAHFYQRLRIRGATTTIFVSPPDLPVFFPELVARMFEKAAARENEKEENHGLHENSQYAALILYSRFDALAMERILGADRAKSAALHQTADDVFIIDADIQQENSDDGHHSS